MPLRNFRIASIPKTVDTQCHKWKDRETLVLSFTPWREAPENVGVFLTKRSLVVANVWLNPLHETNAGERRTVIEVQVDGIGLSLTKSPITSLRG